MKNPNGYGTVYKLSGHRRKPWCAAGPAKRDGSRMKRDVIGYFESRKEAMLALSQWHIAPPAAKAEMTLQELRDEWKAVKYQTLDKSTKDGYNAAWKNLAPLYDRRVADIRTGEFQAIIDNLSASYSKLHQIKVLCTQLKATLCRTISSIKIMPPSLCCRKTTRHKKRPLRIWRSRKLKKAQRMVSPTPT